MLIDFHTHAFPTQIAGAALQKLARSAGGLIPHTAGTVDSLKDHMARAGVDQAVVLSIATNPAQQSKVNDFAMAVNRDPALFAFGSVHPEAEDALAELERLKEAGIKGVKFHPEYQGFYADDERMKPIYRKISQLGLLTLFHAGQDIGFSPPYHAMPEHLKGALRLLDTPVIAAHWGGMGCSEAVVKQLCGENLYFDLSFGYGVIPKPLAQQIIDTHTPDRLLFGSDLPWHSPVMEGRLLDTLDLSPTDRDKICYQNAQKLLGEKAAES